MAPPRTVAPACQSRSASPVWPGKAVPGRLLPAPAALVPFGTPAAAGEGTWSPADRAVRGIRVIYQTTLVPPGGTKPAGIAWMDTGLLSARLYSGSESPGGGPYQYTAPIRPA